MPERNQAALDFLLTRRSRPAKTLAAPAPTREELQPLLTAALRTPDHGKLEPWRLMVLEAPALRRLAEDVAERAKAKGLDEDMAAKARLPFDTSPLAVAVVHCPVDSDKVPFVEQTYSAGAVCLSLLNAALAAGWGANWLSGWISHDANFRQDVLGLKPEERIAGLIHIGTEKIAPPERPRPSLEDKVTWHSA